MGLVDLNPAGLNLTSLKPYTPEADAQTQTAKTQQQLAQVQLTNAQDEQQRNNAFRTSMAIAAKAPSVETYTQLLAIAPREYVEGLKASISQMDAAGKKKLADQVLEPWIAGSNGRLDLMKQKLEAQAAGFEAAGMVDKAKGVRDLIAKADSDPNGVISKLGATYLEAAGPERFKALGESLGWDTKRRKDKADRIKAEHGASEEMLDAAQREAVAKARDAELGADIKEIEKPLTRRKILSTIGSQEAQAYRDTQSGDHTRVLTRRDIATFDDDVAKAADDARKARADATVAQEAASPEAAKLRADEAQTRVKKIKQEAETLRAQARDIPSDMRKESLDSVDRSMVAFADVTRIRKLEEEYKKIPASAGGAPERFAKWTREVLGNESKRDAVYLMAENVIKQEVLNEAKNLRPVSDTDMAILRGDKPKATSKPAYVARWLNALANAREAQGRADQGRSAWINTFRGPYNADQDTEIMGRQVKAGTTMADFLNRHSNPITGMTMEQLRAREAELAGGKK